MKKDFDGTGWAASHEVDFRQLISSARATRGAAKDTAQAMATGSNGTSERSEEVLEGGQHPSIQCNSSGTESNYLPLDRLPSLHRNESNEQYSNMVRLIVMA